MTDVELRRPVTPADVDTVRRVAAEAERAAGHARLGDAVWRDLADPSTETAVVIARREDNPVGVLHIGEHEDGPARGVRLSTAILPDAPAEQTLHDLLDIALADRRQRGGGPVELWVFGADPGSDHVAGSFGFDVARELCQLRVTLPLHEAPRWPAGVTVRPFEPGRDDDAWLTVNNRAFATDPDQGGWDLATLAGREREPWFEPAGFLLAVDARGLAGFCWTRVHPAAPPMEPLALGEIYVIGVDPDRQGQGLGRALVVAGLADLHDRHDVSRGMLFVDRSNDAAVRLYRSIGFTLTRVDRAYRCPC